jgi:hypothetical protein
MQKPEIKPGDFPVEADKDTLRTSKGKPIATAKDEQLAEEIAGRLNEQADREEQDRWSA